MRTIIALLALTLAGPVFAFDLGSTDIGPAPGRRKQPTMAAYGDGYIAAWADRRSLRGDIYAARFGSDGAMLDPEGMYVGTGMPPWTTTASVLVASDGENALILWEGWGGALVTRDGVRSVSRDVGYASALALAWTGTHYLFIYGLSTPHAVLLDRDGTPVSGHLSLSERWADPELACAHGRCFVALPTSRGTAGGFLTPDLFPRAGETADAPPFPALFGATEVAVGHDDDGFYSIREQLPGRFVMQRHGAAMQRRFWFEAPPAATELLTASDGVTTHLAYTTEDAVMVLVRILDGAADIETAENRFARAIVYGRAGLLALWSDHGRTYAGEEMQHFAALANDRAWTERATLVSASRPRAVMPRLAAGTTTYLAVWLETRKEESLMYTLLDRDGRPLGAPRRLASTEGVRDAVIAFDGDRFLVVWNGATGARGRFVMQNGDASDTLAGPLSFNDLLGSLHWDGSQYHLALHSGIQKIAPSGALLDRYWLGDGAAFLARDPAGDRGLAVALERPMFWPYLVAGYTQITRTGPQGDPVFHDWRDVAPAVTFAGGALHGVVHVADENANTLRFVGSGNHAPYPAPAVDWFPTRVHRLGAHPFGDGFLIVAGKTLARHAADESLLDVRTVAGDAEETAVALDGDTVLALFQRGSEHRFNPGPLPRIETVRLELRPQSPLRP